MSSASSDAEEREPTLCPSALCEPDAILLGAVGADGRIGYLTTRVRIDADFVREANSDGRATSSFRFAQPCEEGACQQWRDGRCAVGDAVAASPESDRARGEDLPHCSIRSQCRWFEQSGPRACRSCALVITDLA